MKPKPKYTHIIPIGGKEPEHVAGDCWCYPLAMNGNVVRHHAKDCREAFERKHGYCRTKDEIWIKVLSPLDSDGLNP